MSPSLLSLVQCTKGHPCSDGILGILDLYQHSRLYGFNNYFNINQNLICRQTCFGISVKSRGPSLTCKIGFRNAAINLVILARFPRHGVPDVIWIVSLVKIVKGMAHEIRCTINLGYRGTESL
jgi:hypothetical protein